MGEFDCKSMMDSADTNNNGQIDFQEFLRWLFCDDESESDLARAMALLKAGGLEELMPKDRIKGIREAFQQFDKDGSLSITVSEMKEVLTQLGQNLTDAQVGDLLSALDEDKSGMVKYDEFLLYEARQIKRAVDPNEC